MNNNKTLNSREREREKSNSTLNSAKKNKNDEFYTLLPEIENELKYYKEFFKNKIIFCNCDDPEYSNFYRYFLYNFEHLQIKKLITTHYQINEKSYKIEVSLNQNNTFNISFNLIAHFGYIENNKFSNGFDLIQKIKLLNATFKPYLFVYQYSSSNPNKQIVYSGEFMNSFDFDMTGSLSTISSLPNNNATI